MNTYPKLWEEVGTNHIQTNETRLIFENILHNDQTLLSSVLLYITLHTVVLYMSYYIIDIPMLCKILYRIDQAHTIRTQYKYLSIV